MEEGAGKEGKGDKKVKNQDVLHTDSTGAMETLHTANSTKVEKDKGVRKG